jgi:hypothetical protein
MYAGICKLQEENVLQSVENVLLNWKYKSYDRNEVSKKM